MSIDTKGTMARAFPTKWLPFAVAIIFGLYYYSTLNTVSTGFSTSSAPAYSNEPSQISYLQKILKQKQVGPEVTFATATLRYKATAKERLSVTEVLQPLFPDKFVSIDLQEAKTLPQGRTVSVPVTKSATPSQIDASMLLFGVSTTYKRFSDPEKGPLKEWTRWLTDGQGRSNGAGIVLCLHEATHQQVTQAAKILIAAGINATVQQSDPSLDMPGRYVSLIDILYNHPTYSARKFYGLIDDDTFFPSMQKFLNRLSTYDHTKKYYIGAFTERMDFIVNHKAPMAFGGAGVIFTGPAIDELAHLDCLATDSEGSYLEWGHQGDHLVYNCLHNHTDLTLTYEPTMHQMDQFGDPSGFYESGRQSLTIHHFKSWHHFIPDKMHIASSACGEDCVLQRFQFSDDFVVSNGFSVAEYPYGISFNMDQIENTFNQGLIKNGGEDTSLIYSFGPMRKNLKNSGMKKAWELIDARDEGNGRVRQIYVKRMGDQRWVTAAEAPPDRDSVIVLLWEP